MTLKEKLSRREDFYGLPMTLVVVQDGRVLEVHHGKDVARAARGKFLCSTWNVIDFYEFHGVAVATFKTKEGKQQ